MSGIIYDDERIMRSKADADPCPQGHTGSFVRYSRGRHKRTDGAPILARQCNECRKLRRLGARKTVG